MKRPEHGSRRATLERALSKLGLCSRSQAAALISAGAVEVDGRASRDPGRWIDLDRQRLRVRGAAVRQQAPVYLMLNKPRGLVTTRRDERDRATVFSCFEGAHLPHVAPVGRLDKASEGLLLFSNDSAWAHGVSAPEQHLDKIYHLQVDHTQVDSLLPRLLAGVRVSDGELLRVKAARGLRAGQKNAWLEITLDEGRNRHLRRLLAACEVQVLRLIRVAIGPLRLGALAKGQWRALTSAEVDALRPPL